MAKIIDELKSIRKSLPYNDHDPVKNRELAIRQLSAICKHLRSLGATPNIFSPITEVLHTLKELEVGRESTLLKPEKIKFSDRDKMLFTMAAASFDFLRDSTSISSKDAAKAILKIMKIYDFPQLRSQSANTSSDQNRSNSDQRSSTAQLAEWAKGCRNGRKGKSAQKQYLEAIKALKAELKSRKCSPTKVIEHYFEISCFGDFDPYRVK